MNNLYFIFSLLNICAIQIFAKPTDGTVYELVTKNFSTTCPTFTQNVIVNNLLHCKDVTVSSLPNKMIMLNLNIFYCVGMMVADLELCNKISNKEYQYLPRNTEELNVQLTNIQQQNVTSVCSQLKNMKLFNAQNIIPKELTEAITELKTKLSGSFCSNICTDIEGNVSDLCAMMNYLNNIMDNVTKTVNTEPKIGNIVPKTKQVLIAPPQEQEHKEVQPQQVIAHVDLSKNVNNANIHMPVNSVGIPPQVPNVEQPQQQKIALVVEKSNLEPHKQKPTNQTQPLVPDATIKPETIPKVESKKEEKIGKPPKEVQKNLQPQHMQENLQPQHMQENLQPQHMQENLQPQHKQENKQHKQIDEVVQPKGETQIQITNVATNANGDKGDKFDFASAEEREYPTTSTAINDIKNEIQNTDNFGMDIENDDDDEVDKNNEEINLDTMGMPPAGDIGNVNELQISSKIKATEDIEESNFFSYFMFISVMFIAGYVVYHNKQKIMALLLEGRRERNSRRRPSTSSYRKLNSNLEEAVTSKCSGSASHVIY